MRRTIRPALAAALLACAAALAAHEPASRSGVETSGVAVRLDADQIEVPHDGGRVIVSFAPASGAVRARVAFVGNRPPDAARLRLPLSGGGHLDIGFRRRAGVLVSTKALSKLVDGTVLELDEGPRTHRLVLRAMR